MVYLNPSKGTQNNIILAIGEVKEKGKRENMINLVGKEFSKIRATLKKN